jgi:RNA polymerase sigma factor (sigma-70 family)
MMRHGGDEFDERFTAFVRSRGQHHIRMATLLTGDPAAAEDLHAAGAPIREALARLPGQQRAVLVLRYCEDLPEAEVASLLGCSAGTIKTHAHRGLRALRQLLGAPDPLTASQTSGPASE